MSGEDCLTPLHAEGGTVVILSCCATQPEVPSATAAQFRERGFDPFIVHGPNARTDPRFKPYHFPPQLQGGSNVAHLAYHHTFLPVLEDLFKGLGEEAWLVVAEDSCVLMDQTKPSILFELAQESKRALWCGYCNKPT